jgi:hypothetical protein
MRYVGPGLPASDGLLACAGLHTHLLTQVADLGHSVQVRDR